MPSELCFPTFQSADPVQLAAASFSNPNQDDEDEDNDDGNDDGYDDGNDDDDNENYENRYD